MKFEKRTTYQTQSPARKQGGCGLDQTKGPTWTFQPQGCHCVWTDPFIMWSGEGNGRGTISNLLLIYAWGPSYCSSVTLDWHPALMKETKQCITIRHLPNPPRQFPLYLQGERTQGVAELRGEKKKTWGLFFPPLTVRDKKLLLLCCLFTRGVSRGGEKHIHHVRDGSYHPWPWTPDSAVDIEITYRMVLIAVLSVGNRDVW